MSYESKLARFIRRGGSGAMVVRLDRLALLERKFAVSPENLLGSIADNALAEGLADLNGYLPEGLSANIRGVDFSPRRAPTPPTARWPASTPRSPRPRWI